MSNETSTPCQGWMPPFSVLKCIICERWDKDGHVSHAMLNQCCFNVGPPSATLAQYWSNICWTSVVSVCCDASCFHLHGYVDCYNRSIRSSMLNALDERRRHGSSGATVCALCKVDESYTFSDYYLEVKSDNFIAWDFQTGTDPSWSRYHYSISRGGGGVCSSAQRRAENFKFITCLCSTDLEVNYSFLAESARNYSFQEYSSPPPEDWLVAPWYRWACDYLKWRCNSDGFVSARNFLSMTSLYNHDNDVISVI